MKNLLILLLVAFFCAESSSLRFSCPKLFGKFKNELDCRSYYLCIFGGSIAKKCPDEKYFDEVERKCIKGLCGAIRKDNITYSHETIITPFGKKAELEKLVRLHVGDQGEKLNDQQRLLRSAELQRLHNFKEQQESSEFSHSQRLQEYNNVQRRSEVNERLRGEYMKIQDYEQRLSTYRKEMEQKTLLLQNQLQQEKKVLENRLMLKERELQALKTQLDLERRKMGREQIIRDKSERFEKLKEMEERERLFRECKEDMAKMEMNAKAGLTKQQELLKREFEGRLNVYKKEMEKKLQEKEFELVEARKMMQTRMQEREYNIIGERKQMDKSVETTQVKLDKLQTGVITGSQNQETKTESKVESESTNHQSGSYYSSEKTNSVAASSAETTNQLNYQSKLVKPTSALSHDSYVYNNGVSQQTTKYASSNTNEQHTSEVKNVGSLTNLSSNSATSSTSVSQSSSQVSSGSTSNSVKLGIAPQLSSDADQFPTQQTLVTQSP